jgi:hypothetical protein
MTCETASAVILSIGKTIRSLAGSDTRMFPAALFAGGALGIAGAAKSIGAKDIMVVAVGRTAGRGRVIDVGDRALIADALETCGTIKSVSAGLARAARRTKPQTAGSLDTSSGGACFIPRRVNLTRAADLTGVARLRRRKIDTLGTRYVPTALFRGIGRIIFTGLFWAASAINRPNVACFDELDRRQAQT